MFEAFFIMCNMVEEELGYDCWGYGDTLYLAQVTPRMKL